MEEYGILNKLTKSYKAGYVAAENVESISKQMMMKGCKELQLCFERLESNHNVILDLLNSLKYLVRHNSNCFVQLEEQGILHLLKVIFQQVIYKIPGCGTSDTLMNILELCTDTANALADVNSNAKSCVALEICPLYLDILLQPITFQTRLEVLKSNNLLLEQCPIRVKEEILNKKQNYDRISGLVNVVKNAGDYELQVALVECLMRLFPRKKRQQCTSRFIPDKDMLDGFMSIKDKDFETDCRLFLNNLNAKSEDPTQGVFSLPCVTAFVGNKELRKPSDPGYEEFWVDFNIGSRRITLFCEQSSWNSQTSVDDMWETVAIYKTDVQQYTCNVHNGLIVVEISLKEPICNLYPSQHQTETDNKISVKFDSSLEAHVTHAVGYTFNFIEKKNKASEVVQPLKISLKEVEQADSQQDMNIKICTASKSSMVSSKDYSSRNARASVPAIPMTPDSVCSKQSARDTYEENYHDTVQKHQHTNNVEKQVDVRLAEVASGLEKRLTNNQMKQKNFTAPKTPKHKPRTNQKVKTPVVTVTPPSKKEKEKRKDSNCVTVNKSLLEPKMDEESCVKVGDESFEVIPDSLPQEEHLMDTNKSRKMKVSAPNKDDSGIHLDDSMSTTMNSSKNISCQNRDNKLELAENGMKSSDNNGEKKKSQKKSKVSNIKDFSGNSNSDKVGNGKNEFSNVPSIPDNKHAVNKKTDKLSAEKCTKDKSMSDTSFGFDSLCIEDNVDCIPDSYEIQTDDVPKNGSKANKPSDTGHESDDAKVHEEKINKNTCITFTDVNSSLKELADLNAADKNEILEPMYVMKNSKRNDKLSHKNKKSKYGESVDNDITDKSLTKTNVGIDKKENISTNEMKKSKSWDKFKDQNEVKKGKPNYQTHVADKSSHKTRSLRSRKGKVNYKDADASFDEELVNEEADEQSHGDDIAFELDVGFKSPDDTPEKVVLNEINVKSSLKKKKKNTEEDCQDPSRRKSRVSFDLPSSQSNEVQLVESEKENGLSKAENVQDNYTKNKEEKNHLPSVSEAFVDSLYIESDDSYNERRYRMEVKDKLKTRHKRSSRSSSNKDSKRSVVKADIKNDFDLANELNSNVIESVIKMQHSDESGYSDNEEVGNRCMKQIPTADDLSKSGNETKQGEYRNTNYKQDQKTWDSTSLLSTGNFMKKLKQRSKTDCRENYTDGFDNLSTDLALHDAEVNNKPRKKDHGIRKKKSRNRSKRESEQDNIDAVEDSCTDLVPCSSKEPKNQNTKDRKTKRENKNLSYPFNESVELKNDDEGFTMQQQRLLQGLLKSGSKQIVFERSYLKSKTSLKSLNNFNRLPNMNVKTEKNYDPYDFNAHCDNSSMASERIGRKDLTKDLKKKKSKEQKNKEKKFTVNSLVEEDNRSDDIGDGNIPVLVGTNLVQDKKTKKWHRVPAEVSNDSQDREKQNKSIESENMTERKNINLGINAKWQDVCAPDMIIDYATNEDIDNTESGIGSFDKIVEEITLSRMKMKKSLESLSNVDTDAKLNDNCSAVLTPCVINSLSSTPKVGSARRKHYFPLNISVIKTPQLCQTVDSDADSDSGWKARNETKKKMGSKKSMSSSHMGSPDSDLEKVYNQSKRRKSRMSTDSVSFLDCSRSTGSKSEKSWILERKKSPRHKNKCKTYKYKLQKYNKLDNAQREEPQEEDDVLTYNKFLQSPITFSSVSCTTPAVTPSYKSVDSFHTLDINICSPVSPCENFGKSTQKDIDIEVEQTQENYCISLDMDNNDNDVTEDLDNYSFSKYAVKTPQMDSLDEREIDGETSMLKLLQQNWAMHGDSGFASGPSSEVRPSRSSLKRKFPSIEEENIIASSCSSQTDSMDEANKSTFIPKKLFKFDLEVAPITPQAVMCDSWNDESGFDVGYQAGFSTSMAAFGADIQKQLQNKTQKIETIMKKSVKETQKHLTQTLVEQQQYQTNLTDNLNAKMITELKAIEKDIQSLCEAEQKAEDFFKYQIDVLRNNRESQRQHLQNMKEMQTTCIDKRKRVNKNNFNACKTIKDHLKCEMNRLQRRLVTEVQKQEYMNIRRRLQNLF